MPWPLAFSQDWGAVENFGAGECRHVYFIYILVVSMLLIEIRFNT